MPEVHLTYFKDGGKVYTGFEYNSRCKEFWNICDEVRKYEISKHGVSHPEQFYILVRSGDSQRLIFPNSHDTFLYHTVPVENLIQTLEMRRCEGWDLIGFSVVAHSVEYLNYSRRECLLVFISRTA